MKRILSTIGVMLAVLTCGATVWAEGVNPSDTMGLQNMEKQYVAQCNYLYFRHVKERIIEIRAGQSPQNLYPVLQEVGGVHKWVIFVAIIVGIILIILSILFFASITTSIERSGVITI